MFCSYCGTALIPGVRFCSRCGNGTAIGGTPAVYAAPVTNLPVGKPLSVTKAILMMLGCLTVLGIIGTVGNTSIAKLTSLFIIGTSIWAAKDSADIRVWEYDTEFNSSLSIFIGMSLLWMVAFPWYLVMRSRILMGRTVKRIGWQDDPAQFSSGKRFFRGLVCVLVVMPNLIWLAFPSSSRDLMDYLQHLSDSASSPHGYSFDSASPNTVQRASSAACLSYEKEGVVLTGKIKTEMSPGRPNFESVEKGDEPENAWILVLEKPICTNEQNNGAAGVEYAETNVQEVQLALMDDKIRPIRGRTVSVKGDLFHAFTGHHHTAVLMSVNSMEPKGRRLGDWRRHDSRRLTTAFVQA
jgi:hypothetical protein